jgi:hypothetical protein
MINSDDDSANIVKSFAIWPAYEAFYVEAMLFNTNSALGSVDDVYRVIAAIDSGEVSMDEIDQHSFLDSLQNIVIHAAMLSRYFWPSWEKPIHTGRAQHLKCKFNLDDSSPLKEKSLRDHLEHLDEKLDKYLSKGITGHIIPAIVTFSYEEQEVPLHLFRAYYLREGVFETLGQRYKLQPIVDEIYRIHQNLEHYSSSGRLPSTDD